MEDIWDFIEDKLKAPVPAYFKSVLNVCGYSNGISISLIEEDDLIYIENEVKSGNVGKALDGAIDFLKGCTRNAENFEFVLGHKKFLLAIASFLKNYISEHGADSLTVNEKHSNNKKNKKKAASASSSTEEKKFVPPSHKRVGKNDERVKPLVQYAMSTKLAVQKRSSSVSLQILEEHRQVLLERTIGCMVRLTPKLFDEHIETIKKKVSGDFLTFELDDDCENQIAVVTCVYCPKTITCFLRPTENNPKIWKTSNFDRHMRIMHRFENSPPAGLEMDLNNSNINPRNKLKKESSDSDEEQSLEEAGEDNIYLDHLDDDGQDKRKQKLSDFGTEEGIDLAMDVAEQNGQTETVNEKKSLKTAGRDKRKEKLGDFGNEVVMAEQHEKIETLSETKMVKKAGKDKRKEKLIDNEGITKDEEMMKSSNKKKQGKKAGKPKEKLDELENEDVTEVDGHNKQTESESKEKQSDFGNEVITKVAEQDKQMETVSEKKIGTAEVDKRTEGLRELSIMRNGFKSRHGNKFIVTTNTCAFDTIFHTFASIYSKYSSVRGQLDNNHSKMSELLESFVNPVGSVTSSVSPSKDIYAVRNTILHELYEGWCANSSIQKNHDTTFIDCKTGIGGLFARICKFEENCASSIFQRICPKCGLNFKKVNPFLKTSEKIRNLQKISEHLDIFPKQRACLKCQSNCQTEMIFNNVVLVETEPKTVHRNEVIKLQDIAPELSICSTTYNLYGVMHFDPKNEHFVAYVHDHNTNWKCLDDTKKNVKKVDAGTVVNPFVLCYVSNLVSTMRQSDIEQSVAAKSIMSTVPILKEGASNKANHLLQRQNEPQDEPACEPELARKIALAATQNEDLEENAKETFSLAFSHKKPKRKRDMSTNHGKKHGKNKRKKFGKKNLN